MHYSALPSFDHALAALREMRAEDVEPMFRILAPDVWGRGIARAVCDALTRWAFEHVGLQRVQGTTLVSNIRSQRVLEACAFEREGLLRRYRMVRGTPGDFWMYARLS